MNLAPVETLEDFALAERFVKMHEETCVSLASLVRHKAENLVFIMDKTVLRRQEVGLLSLDSTVYHCILDCGSIDARELAAVLGETGAIKKPVRCISGELAATDFLADVLGGMTDNKLPNGSNKQPKQVYPYRMMRLASTAPLSSPDSMAGLAGGEEIVRCTENDMECLTALQKDYMKEEIAVPGRTISDAEASIMLRQILKNQICFALLVDGEPVAKANSNAIGYSCVQIGGVYTHPLYRHNGYAAALVITLCRRALRAGKQPVLFVKEKNTPALALYQKIGFAECGQYKIAYY